MPLSTLESRPEVEGGPSQRREEGREFVNIAKIVLDLKIVPALPQCLFPLSRILRRDNCQASYEINY